MVCPGCGKEVRLSDPHMEVLKHGKWASGSGIASRSVFGRDQSTKFHNDACLKN